jgi:cardiolipin synthase A/B
MSAPRSIAPSAAISLPARWLPTGAEAYSRMLDLIAAAKVSIRCETYIWGDDAVGTRFHVALAAAAKRGVRVQVLIDGAGSSALPTNYWYALTSAGGEARVFNPLKLRNFSLRNHRKLLLIDDTVAITGGFNLAVEYDGDGVTIGWRDLGLELRDSRALHQLANSFDHLFAEHRVRRWLLGSLQRATQANPFSHGSPGPVLFSGPHLGRNQFTHQLLRSLRQARHVRIVSAYFVPGFRLRRALRRVARRGGNVELLLAGRTDVPLAQSAARSLYGSLLKSGIRIWEYQPQVLHTKLAIVDDAVFVGSANLDARSLSINYELTVHLRDPLLSDAADAIFNTDVSHAQAVTFDSWSASRTWLTRLQGAWARFLLARVDPWLARRQIRRIR